LWRDATIERIVICNRFAVVNLQHFEIFFVVFLRREVGFGQMELRGDQGAGLD
jgi:hypothetical protein